MTMYVFKKYKSVHMHACMTVKNVGYSVGCHIFITVDMSTSLM